MRLIVYMVILGVSLTLSTCAFKHRGDMVSQGVTDLQDIDHTVKQNIDSKVSCIDGITLFTQIIDEKYFSWAGPVNDNKDRKYIMEYLMQKELFIPRHHAKLASLLYQAGISREDIIASLSFYPKVKFDIDSITLKDITISINGVKATASLDLTTIDCRETEMPGEWPELYTNDKYLPALVEITALRQQLLYLYYEELNNKRTFSVDIESLFMEPVNKRADLQLKELKSTSKDLELVFIPMMRRDITKKLYIDLIILHRITNDPRS